ncbi:hypothetical protein ADIARSV_0485 [Arcticibacter svalbardensis MN12-7]|uniref:Uncharacterized protein n=1 Tax=Arcticibacter svalbardensis MN12-7 TaxID=1150600 RepID=R9H584_9SPHI|nr:hypothetical protein [Arcticibacter svalbardensis]EOR96339.1 hypothetical protein ADIARSV_0485 [Arcticibacter svalbardensis MN12-7]
MLCPVTLLAQLPVEAMEAEDMDSRSKPIRMDDKGKATAFETQNRLLEFSIKMNE